MINIREERSVINAVSPMKEMAAYEALWRQRGASFKSIADKFRAQQALPSELVSITEITEALVKLKEFMSDPQLDSFGIRIHGTGDYPKKLRDARNPVEILYYQGWWDLVNTRCVAVVGARKVSEDGIKRTSKLGPVYTNYTIDNQ